MKLFASRRSRLVLGSVTVGAAALSLGLAGQAGHVNRQAASASDLTEQAGLTATSQAAPDKDTKTSDKPHIVIDGQEVDTEDGHTARVNTDDTTATVTSNQHHSNTASSGSADTNDQDETSNLHVTLESHSDGNTRNHTSSIQNLTTRQSNATMRQSSSSQLNISATGKANVEVSTH
jgi:hypothetical protein